MGQSVFSSDAPCSSVLVPDETICARPALIMQRSDTNLWDLQIDRDVPIFRTFVSSFPSHHPSIADNNPGRVLTLRQTFIYFDTTSSRLLHDLHFRIHQFPSKCLQKPPPRRSPPPRHLLRQRLPAEKKEAGKKTAATGDKKKRTKTRKETYSSYIYKGTFPLSHPQVAFPRLHNGAPAILRLDSYNPFGSWLTQHTGRVIIFSSSS